MQLNSNEPLYHAAFPTSAFTLNRPIVTRERDIEAALRMESDRSNTQWGFFHLGCFSSLQGFTMPLGFYANK